MLSIINRALSWAITSFGNNFCLIKRSRLIRALDNRFYVRFMQLEIGLLQRGYRVIIIVFKNSQQQHCLLRNTIIGCHVRSDLSMPGARANEIAISSFCPLFHFSARCFNKNSKTTNQSDLRNNAWHVIKRIILLDLFEMISVLIYCVQH